MRRNPHPSSWRGSVLAASVLSLAVLVALAFFLWPTRAKQATHAHSAQPEQHPTRARGVRSGRAPRAMARLSGQVRDGVQGVIGARVCAISTRADLLRDSGTCVESGAGGQYVFPALASGQYYVTASAPHFALSPALNGEPVALAEGEALAGIDIALRSSEARVHGHVLDALGGPVPHARVRALGGYANTAATVELETGDDGAFELWAERGQLTLVAAGHGYATASQNVRAPSAGVALVLMPESRIAGRVVTRDGTSVAGVTVRALLREPRPSFASPAISDGDGAFAIEALEPGVYQLEASSERAQGLSVPIELDLGESIEDFLVQVEPAVVVAGRVSVGDGGAPCSRGYVSLSREGEPAFAMDALDQQGNVELRGVAAGHYAVNVQCLDSVLSEGPRALDVAADDMRDLAWRTQPGLGLAIAVRDERGDPVPHAPIAVQWPSADGATLLMPLSTDERGHALVERNLAPGRYVIEPLSGLRGEPVSVELREGMGSAEVVLQLEGSAELVVEARTPSGDPIDGAEVRALELDAEQLGPVTEFAEPGVVDDAPHVVHASALGGGQYRIAPLRAGRYRLQADDGRSAPVAASAELALRAGQRERAEIVLDRTEKLSGRVTDESGAPVANLWVQVTADQAQVASIATTGTGGRTRALTDASGAFELEGLAPDARYTVRAERRDGAWTEERDVPAGSSVELRLAPPEQRAELAAQEGLDGPN